MTYKFFEIDKLLPMFEEIYPILKNFKIFFEFKQNEKIKKLIELIIHFLQNLLRNINSKINYSN